MTAAHRHGAAEGAGPPPPWWAPLPRLAGRIFCGGAGVGKFAVLGLLLLCASVAAQYAAVQAGVQGLYYSPREGLHIRIVNSSSVTLLPVAVTEVCACIIVGDCAPPVFCSSTCRSPS